VETIGTELSFLLDLVSMEIWMLDEYAPLDVDVLVGSVIDQGGVPVISHIDRVDRAGPRRFIVIDYKTNAQPFSRDEVEKSFQLCIYDLAVRALFADEGPIEVECVFDMVRHGRFPVTFTADRREEVRSYLVSLWHQIRRTKTPPLRRNQYCYACELRGSCPVYQDLLESEVPEVLTDDADLLALVEQWETLSVRGKAIETRREELGSMLSTLVVTADGAPVKLRDGREVYLQPNPWSEYPPDRVYELFAAKKALVLLRDVMSIGKQKMDRALRGVPFRAEVEGLLIRTFKKSSVKVRNSKNATPEEAE
jgi:hypothetical protein